MTVIEWRRAETGECERLEDVPVGATVEAIDDKEVVARCEGCSAYIVDGNEYKTGEDIYLCMPCYSDEPVEQP